MYDVAYKMPWLNVENVECEVRIYDTDSDPNHSPDFIPMQAAGDPCHLYTIDNDESKFTPVMALNAEIRILSSDTINLTTFSNAYDFRWYVEIIVGAATVFKGFLTMDDSDQDFLADEAENVITLVATDGLGLLKGITLTDDNDLNPRGFFNLVDLVSFCLQKTGLQLPINVQHDVREEHTPTQPMYRSCFLWAKSFELEVGESVNCYQALEEILGEDSFLTQSNGEWFIKRVDEFGYATIRTHRFEYFGEYIETIESAPILQDIGSTETMYFSDRRTFVKLPQPFKSVAERYPFDYPKELIDNIDFSMGAVTTAPDMAAANSTGVYEADYWTAARGFGSIKTTADFPDPYIERRFEYGYEKERYIAIDPPGSVTAPAPGYIESNPMPIHAGDKISVSIDYRWATDGSGQFWQNWTIWYVRLEAFDGTYYLMHNDGTWVPTNATYTSQTAGAGSQFYMGDDQTEWRTVSKNGKPAPKDGYLYINLMHPKQTSGPAETAHFTNLQVHYTPYINGSYQLYKAQEHKVTGTERRKQTHEETVKMSDSPKQIFKGALHRYNATAGRYVLTGRFYDGLQFGSTVPADQYLTPFGHNQTLAVWNQMNRELRLFDFQVQGLNTDGTIPSLLHEYRITDTDIHTTNKKFQLLWFEQDLNLCEWRGVLLEFQDSTIPKDYSQPKTFRYIEER